MSDSDLAERVAAALAPIAEAHSAWGGDPDEWLHEPAFAANRAVLEAAAINPHLPPASALALAVYLPAEIARHPAFDVTAASEYVIEHVAGYLDEARLRRLFPSSAAVRELVVFHEPPLADLLARLALAGDKRAGERIAAVADQLPAELLVALYERSGMLQFYATAPLRRRAEAGTDPPSLTLLDTLSDQVERDQLARALASNPHTAVRDLERLLADPETVHLAEANPNAPRDLIALMDHAFSLFYEATEIAAGREDEPWMNLAALTAEQIMRLDDAGPLAREAVARLPQHSPEELDRLSRSDDVWVRRGVAQNPSAPAGVLARLAADLDDSVRELVADNPAPR